MIGFISEIASLYVNKEPCLSKSAFYLLVIGTLAALPALFAGVFFTGDLSGAAGEIKATHEMFAWITLTTLLAASVLSMLVQFNKKNNPLLKWAAFILYGLGAIAAIRMKKQKVMKNVPSAKQTGKNF